MVWNFTAYILWKYAERVGAKEGISFRDFSEFVFARLGRNKKVFFHDGKQDLLKDIKYLEELGFVNIKESEHIDDWIIQINKEKLKAVADSLESFAKSTGVGLMMEYLNRIKQAVNEMKRSVMGDG
jgi:hypothetical protein